MSTPSAPQFWEEKYLSGATGWDKGECAPPIRRMLRSDGLAPASQIAVIGAGLGHEAFEAAACGYAVTAIDFAASAVKAMKQEANRRGLALNVLHQDVFQMGNGFHAAFDAVVEHTCFCAIEPSRRYEYAEVMHQVLRPGGRLLGLFFAHGRAGGPPFDVQADEITEVFSGRFEIRKLKPAPDSFPARMGQELEFDFLRKDD